MPNAKLTLPGDSSDGTLNLLCLGIPLAVSLGIKLFLLSQLHDGTINMDGTLYITVAMHFAAGDMTAGLAMFPMPAYSLLLALTHAFIPNWFNAAYFIAITSMVLATVPLYLLTKQLFDIKAAFWACMMFALLPKLNEWSLYVSRDALFLSVAAWFIYIALNSHRKNSFLLFGITFFLAWISILIRIEGLLFLIFYTVLLIHQAITAPAPRDRHYVKLLIWLGVPLCAGMIIAFVMGLQGLQVHRFDQAYQWLAALFNGDFLTSYHQLYNFLSEAENHPPFSQWNYNFAELSRHYLLIIYMMGIIEALLKVISPLSCIPLYKASRLHAPAQGKWLLMLGAMFIGLVYYALLTRDYISTRFLMMPGFLLLPWIGTGIKGMWNDAVGTPRPLRLRLLLSLVILVPMVLTLSLIRHNDNTLPRAMAWLVKNHTANTVTIVTNAKRAPFYTAMETDQNPAWTVHLYTKKDLKEIESFAITQQATFLVLKQKDNTHQGIPPLPHFEAIANFSTQTEKTTVFGRRSPL